LKTIIYSRSSEDKSRIGLSLLGGARAPKSFAIRGSNCRKQFTGQIYKNEFTHRLAVRGQSAGRSETITSERHKIQHATVGVSACRLGAASDCSERWIRFVHSAIHGCFRRCHAANSDRTTTVRCRSHQCYPPPSPPSLSNPIQRWSSIQRRKIAETLQNNFIETLQYCMVVAESLLQDSNNVRMSAFCYITTKYSSNIAM